MIKWTQVQLKKYDAGPIFWSDIFNWLAVLQKWDHANVLTYCGYYNLTRKKRNCVDRKSDDRVEPFWLRAWLWRSVYELTTFLECLDDIRLKWLGFISRFKIARTSMKLSKIVRICLKLFKLVYKNSWKFKSLRIET